MKRSRAKRTALVTLAAIFLAVAGVWDAFVAIGRRLAGFVPWERFKQAFAVLIDRLPAPLVLLIFLVPFLIVEPLLVVATVAIAMGYVVSGAIAWIVLKLLAVGLLPAIFDLTQHKLMTMPWFVARLRQGGGVSSLRRSDRRALQGSRRGSAAPMAAQGGRGDEAGSRIGSACRALCRPPAGGERQAAGGLEGVKRSLRQLHPCAMAGGAGETAVASEERRVERFGERDIDGVIGRQIGAQFPHALARGLHADSAGAKDRRDLRAPRGLVPRSYRRPKRSGEAHGRPRCR